MLLLAGGLTMGTTGCGKSAHHAEEHGDFPVTHPLKKGTELTKEYVAQIRAIQHIDLRAMERGYLDTIFVDEGQQVKKGQRMFQIMPMILKAELQKAKAETEFAEIEYKNTQALQEKNVVSPNELALAKARLDKARAEQMLAQVHLDLTEVRAPFDGIMNRLEVRQGSLVDEGELLTTLSDNSKMWVYFNVTEAEYLDFKMQMKNQGVIPVRLRMANGRIFPYEGAVETIEADFNNETGNIAFRATFPNPEGLLRHGETGNVLMSSAIDDALLIPQKATFDVLDKHFVFVVDEQHIAHLREITVLEELPHLYVVGEGLDEKDEILLDGLRKVRDGQEVHTHFEEPETVMAHLDVHAE
ncbi:MAG: efflux RND transporter periplasmic adaptor subunit [Alphaproteobacteria bacterium]|nr:efflux RND transporter periplasmic adaptor subunit [Alphaproteobacteria bacterium]